MLDSLISLNLFKTLLLVVVLVIVYRILRVIVNRHARRKQVADHRRKWVLNVIIALILIILISGVFGIWGVALDDLWLFLGSIFTVIGVAMFAVWSILSNVTASVILFSSFPYKIGDYIKIMDKDFVQEPVKIIDIKAFYVLLETPSGTKITYPNNLMLQKAVSITDETITEVVEEKHDFTD